MNTQQQQSDQRASPVSGSGMWKACARAADLLFPPSCVLCGISMLPDDRLARRIQLCDQCLRELAPRASGVCRRCARPLPGGATVESHGCPACRSRRLRFDRCYAIGVYRETLREAVLQMKSSAGESLTLAMGKVLGAHLARNITTVPSHLAVVPTHWTRRLHRNVNCPEILLESVASCLRLRSSPGLIRCQRKTNKQGTLLPVERLANVRGAYRVSTGYAMNGANVLLIDDVMTTGATANEIAKILRRAGAKRVEVAVIARGIGFDD